VTPSAQPAAGSPEPVLEPVLEQLQGKLYAPKYYDPDSGYIVVRLNGAQRGVGGATAPEHPPSSPERLPESPTLVGTIFNAQEGMEVVVQGHWTTGPHGRQFQIVSYELPYPKNRTGVIAYLKTLSGCGETLAANLWAAFGEQTLTIFEQQPERLLEVKGVGPKNHASLIEAFEQSRGIQRLVVLLGKIGVPVSNAARIYQRYGDEAMEQISSNPYLLAEEVRGLGFRKADEIARGLGVAPDAELRYGAAIAHLLRTAANQDGHCWLPAAKLLQGARDHLALPGFRPPPEALQLALHSLQGSLVTLQQDQVYLTAIWQQEQALASQLRQLCRPIPWTPLKSPKTRRGKSQAGADQSEAKTAAKTAAADGENTPNPADTSDPATGQINSFLTDFEAECGYQLSPGQRQAIEAIATSGLTVITGGAGVGKSTIAKAVLQLWHRQGLRVIAAAPTGRAAKRLRETTGYEASTLHRLLGWSGKGFDKNVSNPLECDAILIDEASMINLALAKALLEAIPPQAVVVMVGDVNQLPAIGAGDVLRDIIEAACCPVVRLSQTFRQAEQSQIIACCQQLLKGEIPQFERIGKFVQPQTDCVWAACPSERIPAAIQYLAGELLPAMGWQPGDIQLLAPMHKTDYGNQALNALIQELWNPGAEVQHRGIRQGDRVVQLQNAYNKGSDGIFNGDIGRVERIDPETKQAWVRFDDLEAGAMVEYEFAEFDQISLAYSLSVHKAQGSEFPVVIVPMTMAHRVMLQRNLFYTALSRGKQLVIVVGEEAAIARATNTVQATHRNTGLGALLAAADQVQQPAQQPTQPSGPPPTQPPGP
jgi:exodeoxyribonuclease V alpha subunit